MHLPMQLLPLLILPRSLRRTYLRPVLRVLPYNDPHTRHGQPGAERDGGTADPNDWICTSAESVYADSMHDRQEHPLIVESGLAFRLADFCQHRGEPGRIDIEGFAALNPWELYWPQDIVGILVLANNSALAT